MRQHGSNADPVDPTPAEQAQQPTDQVFRALIEHASDIITITDIEGVISYESPSVERVLGDKPAALIGTNIATLVHPDDRPQAIAVCERLREAVSRGTRGAQHAVEARFRHKDGSWRVLEGTAAVLDIPSVTGIVINVRDVTERKRAEEEIRTLYAELERRVAERTAQLEVANRLKDKLLDLRQYDQEEIERLNKHLVRRAAELAGSNKELEAFAYSVSHDLRAPLRHLEGFAELLLKRAGANLDEAAARYTHAIADSATKMSRLIDELLDFSRTTRAEMRTQRSELAPLIRDIQSELAPAMQGRRIMWSVGALPAVEADPILLRVALTNLLSNAIKFTAPRAEARIDITASAENGDAVISVRDNGVGFDPQYGDKLFGVFQRLHRDDEFEGTGIGLATVRRIIHRHGGRVWADSTVGGGATFYFTLPIAKG